MFEGFNNPEIGFRIDRRTTCVVLLNMVFLLCYIMLAFLFIYVNIGFYKREDLIYRSFKNLSHSES